METWDIRALTVEHARECVLVLLVGDTRRGRMHGLSSRFPAIIDRSRVARSVWIERRRGVIVIIVHRRRPVGVVMHAVITAGIVFFRSITV